MNAKDHIAGLDLLRALAILSVLVHHGNYILPPALGEAIEHPLVNGITVFFVLSGYLIGSMLLRGSEHGGSDGASLMRFWKRRWMRTLPAYYVVLLLLTVMSAISGKFPLTDIAPYYVFAQSITQPHPTFFPEAWSLAVQQWFYLVVPGLAFLAVGVLRMQVGRALLVIALLGIALSIALRLQRFDALSGPIDFVDWNQLFKKPVVMRMDSLLLGVLGALLARYRPLAWNAFPRVKLVLGLAGLVVLDQVLHLHASSGLGRFACVHSFTLTGIAILLILPFFQRLSLPAGRFSRAVALISNTSYSIYLTHLSLVQFKVVNHLAPLTMRLTGITPGEAALTVYNYMLYLGLTAVFTFFLHRYVEMPFIRMRDRKASAPRR